MKNALKAIIFIILTVVSGLGFNVLLKPKRFVEISVDNYHDEHVGMYELPDDSIDVLYLGSSHSFSSVSPEDIYKNYGITGYVQASSLQKVWQSYYYLEEALYTQHPKLVVLDTFMALDGNPQGESFNREAIEKMRYSPAKLSSAVMAYELNPEGEDLVSYMMPAFRYHDRWEQLSEMDFKYPFMPSTCAAKGFLPRIGFVPAEFNLSSYEDPNTEPTELNEICDEYLTKINELCRENGIELILVKYPTCWWYKTYSLTMENWADANGVKFLDFNADAELRQEAGIDWSVDSLDGGNHLNYDGAMKMSDWLGRYLTGNYSFADKRSDPEYKVWDDDYAYYKKCVDSSAVPSINDINAYLDALSKNDYIAVVTADNIDMIFFYGLADMLNNFGVQSELLTNAFQNANISVIETSAHKSIYSAFDAEEVSYKGKIAGRKILADSKISEAGQTFSCIYDKKETAINNDGLQFVVIDPDNGKVVDTSVWLIDSEYNLIRQ